MLRKFVIVALIALLLLPAGALGVGGMGGQCGCGGGSGSGGSITVTPLTADEVHWLQYMREEEKLARDVYLALYAKWGTSIFSNIASSEQHHMDAVKTLLDRYGVADPALSQRGKFSNQRLQGLFDTLYAKGILSRKDALEASVIVEQTDIADLNTAIAASGHTDITNIFTNLRQGSYHHLSAFNSQLSNY